MTFLVGGVPDKDTGERPEETVLEALRVQNALLTTAAKSPLAATSLTDPEAVPMLGHGIKVMLDAAIDGVNPLVQLEALDCISAIYKAIRDQEALANFLPGTVSTFANLLSSPSRQKSAVLVKCLESCQTVLIRVLADVRTALIVKRDESADDKNKVLSKSWLEATAAKIKLALSPMMKLRSHDSDQVRLALERLCISLLDECHDSLRTSSGFLVETAIILDPGASDDFSTETNLAHLARIYPELEDALKTAVYNWMTSLPRVMQSVDRDAKAAAVHNLLKGMQMLQNLNIPSTIIQDLLPMTLRDTVSSAIGTSLTPTTAIADIQLYDQSSAVHNQQFQPVLLGQSNERELKTELQSLITAVAQSTHHKGIMSSMLEAARTGHADSQVSAYWLCYQMIRAMHSSSSEEDDLLNLSSFDDDSNTDFIFDELYAYSVQILDNHSDAIDMDWRLEAIAMELTSYAAQRAGAAFRPELIDVLFPIATFLGSDNANLQQHAVVTLNSLSSSCGYKTVSELIIGNVDYMVNSVSLRLNTLDISPASTQVLAMMIRLAGPRLIPFLDDVVDSIFAALDNYHGYPAFVESLFVVLKEVVNQAVQTDKLLLQDRERAATSHEKKAPKTPGISNLLEFIQNQNNRRARDAEEVENISHPKRPWTADDESKQDDEVHDQGDGRPHPEEEKKPNSPTYQLVNRVANLTQYYLTSPTPQLRRSLLELLATASKVLAADEDAFLPLINSIWPVVITRLHDPESFVVIEACHALSGLCEAAGDFLSSRVKTEWADGLGNWCRRIHRNATTSTGRSASAIGRPTSVRDNVTRGADVSIPVYSDGKVIAKSTTTDRPTGSLGQHASPVRIWEAVAKLLTSIVKYVRIDEAVFDEVLDMLGDSLERGAEVREALEAINADAVWLWRYERGLIEPLATPSVPGVTFIAMRVA